MSLTKVTCFLSPRYSLKHFECVVQWKWFLCDLMPLHCSLTPGELCASCGTWHFHRPAPNSTISALNWKLCCSSILKNQPCSCSNSPHATSYPPKPPPEGSGSCLTLEKIMLRFFLPMPRLGSLLKPNMFSFNPHL